VTAEDYVREVEFALRDLPWQQRRELVAELQAHLAEFPPDADLVERLGSPEQYAADMRAAAGLERRRGSIAFLRARRPRNLILVVLLLTAIGLSIGAVVWIDSYQPIVYGSGGQLPLDSTPSRGQAGVTVVFRKGRPFLYGTTIENRGRFAVRILGVPNLGVPTNHVFDFYNARLLMNKPRPYGGEGPLEPFRPFDLHPGETRWLVWKGVYACTDGAEPGFTTTKGSIFVRYSFLWRTATAEIRLEEPLEITFSKGGCPPVPYSPPKP